MSLYCASMTSLAHVSLVELPLESLQYFLWSPKDWAVYWACPEVPAVAPQRRTERSLCAAVTQHSGRELRLKAVELHGLSGPLQRHCRDSWASSLLYAAVWKVYKNNFEFIFPLKSKSEWALQSFCFSNNDHIVEYVQYIYIPERGCLCASWRFLLLIF